MFIALFFLLFLIIVFLSFFEDEVIRKQKWLLPSLALMLTLFVAFRPEGIDNDYMVYVRYIEFPDDRYAALAEPTFKLISGIARLLEEPLALFFLYALLAIPLKVYSIQKLSPYWYLSILVWLVHLFIIQDMTQIRVAVSSAIFLFSLPILAEGNKKRFIICIILAMLFHFSAMVLLPLAVFGNKKLTQTWKYVLWILPLAMYVSPMMSIEILYLLPIPVVQEKLAAYEAIMQSGMWDELNTLNIMALARLFAYYMLLWKYEYLDDKYPYMPLLLKVFCYSICVYVGFSFLPVLATRSQELVGVVDFILFPLLAVLVRPHWLGRTLVIIYATGIFLANLFLYDYLKF